MFLLNIISDNLYGTGQTGSVTNIPYIEKKITDLESLLKSLYLNQSTDFDPDTDGIQSDPALDSIDISAVEDQLELTKQEYQSQLLRNDFFNGTSLDGKTADGYNMLLQLQKSLAQIKNDTEGDEIREKIAQVESELLLKIPLVQNEEWFKTFIGELPQTLSDTNTEKSSTQNKLTSLNEAYIALLTGEKTEVTFNGITYNDPQQLREQILGATLYIEDLNSKSSFLNTMSKLASDDESTVESTLNNAIKSIDNETTSLAHLRELTDAQYNLMEIQALLTKMKLASSPNATEIQIEFDEAKEQEASLRSKYGYSNEINNSAGLLLTQKLNSMVSEEITDLEATQQILGKINNAFYTNLRSVAYVAPDYFYYEDPNLIRIQNELENISEYKKSIEESEAYWQKVTKENTSTKISDNTSTNLRALETTQGTTGNIASKTPQTMQKIIKNTEQFITDLQDLHSIVSDRQSIEALDLEEEEIRNEIEYELNKARSGYINHPVYSPHKNPSLDNVNDLKARLSNVIQLKSYSRFMSQINDSVKEVLSKGKIMSNRYSGYS